MSVPAKEIVNNYTLFPSIAGGMIEKDGELDISTYGVKALDKKSERVKDTTPYIIGSCSKSMTATMIMKACYTRHIMNPMRSITIGSVVPTVQDAYKNVTLKQLLCMTAGIIDTPTGSYSPANDTFWEFFIKSTDDLKTQRAQLVEKVCGKNAPPPAFTPGTAYKYSNLGYIVAAHVIEVKFKSTYEDMMSKYLFDPLKMEGQTPTVPITTYSQNAVGHSVMGKGQEKNNTWLKWNKTVKNLIPSLPEAPKITEKDTIAFVVDTELQYPPPVLGPAGTICLDMKSWLLYLDAVMMNEPSFLPKRFWKTLVNTGVSQNEWFPPHKIVKSSQMYSFGWIYEPSNPDFLFYTGYIFTFNADIFIQQGEIALAAVTNSGRGPGGDTEPLRLLEYALCPSKFKDMKSKIAAFIKVGKDNPSVDSWPPLENAKTESFKNMISSTYSIHIPSLLLIILFIVLLKKQGKFI